MSFCAWIAIQVCPHGENAAFLCALIYRAARDRSSRFARTCLRAHGEGSMCLRCETAAVFGRMISLCVRRKFVVGSRSTSPKPGGKKKKKKPGATANFSHCHVWSRRRAAEGERERETVFFSTLRLGQTCSGRFSTGTRVGRPPNTWCTQLEAFARVMGWEDWTTYAQHSRNWQHACDAFVNFAKQ